MFVFLWLISLSIISSKSIHIVANGRISLFYGWVIVHMFVCIYHIFIYHICIYIYINVYHIFFIHTSVDGHLGCFHILAIINNAAMSTGTHVSFWINVFLFFIYIYIYIPRSGISGSYVVLFLVFWGICILFYVCCAVFNHVQFFVTSWTVARQAPLSMEFFRQECQSGFHFLPQAIFLT